MSAELEVWGGVECTVNRVGDRFFDQLERSGHAQRHGDIGRLGTLGIQALRFPVIWERTAPRGPEHADWSWSDGRLEELRALGIRPIVGLVHHGSGPPGTSLLDPTFPSKLAAYARSVAQRYPWVRDFTPVNEPLTTARFSALYGHWYPHARDDRAFAQALVTQCRAIALAMRAIREVTPGARLVQTEDMGTVFSTRALEYQAAFENERRFVSLDLLSGRVDRHHPLRAYLETSGISADVLDALVAEACPPDVIGINYYVTSDRFLDERIERYPAFSHGGNGRQAYADVEAVRVRAEGIVGHQRHLVDVWRRYGRSVAVTEAHAGARREDQMRWLIEAFRGAVAARAEGADVEAVTAWALFGSFDWDSLVTQERGHYEPGAFDVRGPRPRRTALGRLLRELATGGGGGVATEHPALASEGWWRRDERVLYPPRGERASRPAPTSNRRAAGAAARPRTILVTGATGTLGRAIAAACVARGFPARLTTRAELDISSRESVERALRESGAWAIVNTAGYVRVDDAETDAARCHRENTAGPATLAAACARHDIALVTFSSDLVFDGRDRTSPYVESDLPRPESVYGRTKARAEEAVFGRWPRALVVRTSAFFGPDDSHNFVTSTLEALAAGRRVLAADDVRVSPTYVPDLAMSTLDLLLDGENGIWHLANRGEISWYDLARSAAERLGVPTDALEPCSMASLSQSLRAPRPPYSVLGSERGWPMAALDDALDRYCASESVAARLARTRAA